MLDSWKRMGPGGLRHFQRVLFFVFVSYFVLSVQINGIQHKPAGAESVFVEQRFKPSCIPFRNFHFPQMTMLSNDVSSGKHDLLGLPCWRGLQLLKLHFRLHI